MLYPMILEYLFSLIFFDYSIFKAHFLVMNVVLFDAFLKNYVNIIFMCMFCWK